MNRTNIKVRRAMLEAEIPQWKLAKLLGISESTLSRKFRDELSDEEQDLMVRIIENKDTPMRRAEALQIYTRRYRSLKRDIL